MYEHPADAIKRTKPQYNHAYWHAEAIKENTHGERKVSDHDDRQILACITLWDDDDRRITNKEHSSCRISIFGNFKTAELSFQLEETVPDAWDAFWFDFYVRTVSYEEFIQYMRELDIHTYDGLTPSNWKPFFEAEAAAAGRRVRVTAFDKLRIHFTCLMSLYSDSDTKFLSDYDNPTVDEIRIPFLTAETNVIIGRCWDKIDFRFSKKDRQFICGVRHIDTANYLDSPWADIPLKPEEFCLVLKKYRSDMMRNVIPDGMGQETFIRKFDPAARKMKEWIGCLM